MSIFLNNFMDAILSNKLVRKTFQLFVDKYCKEQIQNIKYTGYFVSKSNYPHFYDILQSCYKFLDVEKIPEVYITNQLKGINALSIGTDIAPMILVSCRALICLSEGELKFLIGHELGHIKQGNLICHVANGLLQNIQKKSDVLGIMLSDLIEVPLKNWCRNNEFKADIAGLMCCKDMKYVYSLMIKILNTEKNSIAPSLMEIYRDHPMIESRIKHLEQYKLLVK